MGRTFVFKSDQRKCLFAEDKHGNKRNGMYEKIAEEFSKETLSKMANLVALSKDVYSIEKVMSIKNVSGVNTLFRLFAWVLNLKKFEI